VTYTAADAAGNTISCSFDVEVVAVNTAPVSENQALTVEAGSTTTVCLKAEDAEGNALILDNVSDMSGAVNNIDVDGLCFDYTAPDEFEGTEIIEVTICDDGTPSLCTVARVEIKVEMVWELEISQLVTPNGDGINDTWIIGNIDKYGNNQVSVFDRWGNKIFYGSNYNNTSICWTGNTDGNHSNSGNAPSGTYFYTIELDDGRSFKGYLELVSR
jgi:gliding motility-associated-like protein